MASAPFSTCCRARSTPWWSPRWPSSPCSCWCWCASPGGGHTRTSAFARRVVSVGVLRGRRARRRGGYQLDPDHFQTLPAVWLAFTGFHCVAGALVRRSGWWRPADESSRNLRWPVFALGVLVLCGLVYLLLRGFDPGPTDAGGGGRRAADPRRRLDRLRARRRRFTVPGVGELSEAEKRVLGRRNRRWHIAGSVLVPAVQAVVIGIGLHQLAQLRWTGRGCSGVRWPDWDW